MNEEFQLPPASPHPAWPRSAGWEQALATVFESSEWQQLTEFLRDERTRHDIFPAESDTFRAFRLTPLENVRFVILGQDPYHGPHQAHGLSFSVPDGIRQPPSLVNIFKELVADVGGPIPTTGDLSPWARQGGLLLNTVLTVRSGEAHSHRKRGWESFTDAVIHAVSEHCPRVAFVLWGRPAQSKKDLIDESRHLILESAHPSPLSAYRGFFGSRPFSRINEWLQSNQLAEIDWSLAPRS